mmetsp:Transcript_77181/g.213365  ORF Transcript_77181/g.213365 Transcript_77181/m.213365 type:complete len:374 (+) Transcript_77181:1091-2212(+)
MAMTSRREVSSKYCVFWPLAPLPACWTLSITTFKSVPIAPTVAYPRDSAAARRISSCALSSWRSKVSQKPGVADKSVYFPVSPRANKDNSHCWTVSGAGEPLHCFTVVRKCWTALAWTSLAEDATTAARPFANVPITCRCACACAFATTEVSLSSCRSLSKGQWSLCWATLDRNRRMESKALPCRRGDLHTFKTAGTHLSIATGAIVGEFSSTWIATCTHRSVMYKSVSVMKGTTSPVICIIVSIGMLLPYFFTRCTRASKHCCLKARLFWLRYRERWLPMAASTLVSVAMCTCEMHIVFSALMAVERVTSFLMRSTNGGKQFCRAAWNCGKSPVHAIRWPKHSKALSFTSWSMSVANSFARSTSNTGSISTS